jgi:hypothetical protein
MNKTLVLIFGGITWAILSLLVINQVYLNILIARSRANRTALEALDADTVKRTLAGLERAQRDADLLSRRTAEALRQIDSLEGRIQQVRGRGPAMQPRPRPGFPEMDQPPPPAFNGGRGWGPEQVVGPPNTMQAGDVSTAWASRMPDGGPEWLKVEYEKETQVVEVRVRETYNPGAITRVTAVLPGGEEALLWEGDEPPAEAPVDRSFPASNVNVRTRSIKVYLDTKKVPGWNEIDAVELIGADGSRQWAIQATASSSYADRSA